MTPISGGEARRTRGEEPVRTLDIARRPSLVYAPRRAYPDLSRIGRGGFRHERDRRLGTSFGLKRIQIFASLLELCKHLCLFFRRIGGSVLAANGPALSSGAPETDAERPFRQRKSGAVICRPLKNYC